MKARVIAYYLPQFHPIPENDKWWEKGFTEWTNVGKARPLFKGHDQPRLPADLGYYDLRVAETREAQAEMAREYGIEGFCYWHYWFGNGKRLLERPFNEVLADKKPNFPFCLAWANESWKGFAHGLKNRNMLIEQLYPGEEDYRAHFHALLPAFKDSRYITVDGKILFMIYKPLQHPDLELFISIWQDLAKVNGLAGFHFVGHSSFVEEIDTILARGMDSVNINRIFSYITGNRTVKRRILDRLKKYTLGMPLVYSYEKMTRYFVGKEELKKNVFPTIVPNWDHSPRSGKEGVVFHNSTPKAFGAHVNEALKVVEQKEEEYKLIFLKSWNEWAEGNYMEPDRKWGLAYLETLKKLIALP
ncbi:MAG: glycoside hydrolase family 99-like domain-containing protein [Sphingobacterium sp.]|nr:glycoside hydrolase family 99-like domain-containing protein [Sphingobacterium sp.]